MLTETEKLFNANKQDWFDCSKGYRHELSNEKDMTFQIYCKCGAEFLSNSPTVAVEWEEDHKHN